MTALIPTFDTNLVKLIKNSYDGNTHNTIVNGYSIDPTLSNDDRQTYTKDGKVYVIHRGTDLKNPNRRWKDLQADIATAFGAEAYNPRFIDAKNHIKELEKKYPNMPITEVGHSIGGGLASYATKHSKNANAITFNKGGSLLSDKGSGKSINYYKQGDLLSVGSYLNGRGKHFVAEPVHKGNPHALTNFV